jgi:hypothetical protein
VANPEVNQLTELSTTSTPLDRRPVCDEWGFYDPEQAGLEAVMRRLARRDQDARTNELQRARGTK